MKFLLTVATVIAVAVAVPAQRGLVVPGPAGPAPAPENPFEPIAIGPAIIDSFEPIAVGPAIVDGFEPISVGPAIIDFPLPDGGVVAEGPIVPGPAVIAPTPAASTPLVQIILNINQAAGSNPIAVSPVDIAAPEIKPEPVQVVDAAPEPVQVIEVAPEPSPIGPPIAVNPIGVGPAPEPVQVVEVAPAPAEPVLIGVPVIPEAAIVLPEELN